MNILHCYLDQRYVRRVNALIVAFTMCKMKWWWWWWNWKLCLHFLGNQAASRF